MLSEAVARDLAIDHGLEWDEDEHQLLAPLIDATLVWAEPATLRRIGKPVIEALWQNGLADVIVSVVRDLPDATLLPAARADLAAGPRRSKLARAYVEQAAVQFAFEEQLPVCCMLCLEEGVASAPPEERRERAMRVARIAARPANVPEAELRAAVTRAAVAGGGNTALALATDERRRAVRAWLGRLGELGAKSVPSVASELRALAAEPLPAAEHDELWRETVAGLTESVGHPWN